MTSSEPIQIMGDNNDNNDNMELSTEEADQPFILASLKVGGDDVMELPQEADGTVLLSTVQAQFPSAVGLKFKSSTGGWRGIRADSNILAAPSGGWGTRTYIVTESDALKRKPASEDRDEERSRGGRSDYDRDRRGGDWDDRRGGDRRGGGWDEPEQPRRRSRKEKLLDDLIVLGLPYGITQEKLREYFTTACGEMTFCQVKIDKATGKSRGFGFVRFKTVEAAEKAMKDSHEIDDRKLVIRLSQKEGDTPTKLFVGSLPQDTTEEEVKTYFSEFGDLVDIFCPNPFRGFAFITFSDESDARKVLEGQHKLKGRRIQVNAAESKTKRDQQQQDPQNQQGGDPNNYTWPNHNNDNWGQPLPNNFNDPYSGNDSYYNSNTGGAYGGAQRGGYSAASSYGSAPGAARGYDNNDNKKPWQRNNNNNNNNSHNNNNNKGPRLLPPRSGADNYNNNNNNNNNRGGPAYQAGGGGGGFGGTPMGYGGPPVGGPGGPGGPGGAAGGAGGAGGAAGGANAEVLNQVKDMLLSFMTSGATPRV